MYGENRTSIQCTTPSLAKLALQPPLVTKVAFVLDGYSTGQWDLIYVEDPLFQDPKLTSKDNKSVVELKVRDVLSCPRCQDRSDIRCVGQLQKYRFKVLLKGTAAGQTPAETQIIQFKRKKIYFCCKTPAGLQSCVCGV